MLNALIMPLAFVAGAEKVCDWCWGRKRRIATAPAGLRNDRKGAKQDAE